VRRSKLGKAIANANRAIVGTLQRRHAMRRRQPARLLVLGVAVLQFYPAPL
jgi:hypothetical protein